MMECVYSFEVCLPSLESWHFRQLYIPQAPKSFTTEHVLELHIHSSQATIARTLESLSSIPSCRPAQPGEFTQRAFMGGRIDLTQAEGLNDLIEAVTEEQRVLALRAVGVRIYHVSVS
jgi:tRNA modification GTPase